MLIEAGPLLAPTVHFSTNCLEPDLAAVLTGDDDRRRARAGETAVRPVAAERAGGEVGRGVLARVLDVDEQRLAIRRFRDAGDFTFLRPDQEAAQAFLARLFTDVGLHRLGGGAIDVDHRGGETIAHFARHGRQHHAVGDVGVRAVVGLDPHQARVRVAEPGAVRTREVVGVRQAGDVDANRIGRRARAEQVDIPGEVGGTDIAAVLRHADDVSVRVAPLVLTGRFDVVIEARICRIHLGHRTAGGVGVGKREIDLTVAWIDRAPLRPVHLGGAGLVRGQAGVHQHVGVIGKRVSGVGAVDAVGAETEPLPFARAVGVEAGDVQLAVVQVLVAGLEAAMGVVRIPRLVGHVLVDVFVARVATHVPHQRPARLDRTQPRAFVREATERGALDGRRIHVERVDLHHPAVGVGDVAIVIAAVRGGAKFHGVPAAVEIVRGVGCDRRPQLAAVAPDAVTAERGQFPGGAVRVVDRIEAAEVAGPVFLAGQVRTPRGLAVRAVVDSAARLRAVGRVLGDHVRRLGGRTGKLHLRHGVDAAVETRTLLVTPRTAVMETALAPGNFDDADAMRKEFTQHLVGVGAHAGGDARASRMQIGRRDGLVVHDQQGAVGRMRVMAAMFAQAEVGHSVVMVAGALGEAARAVGAVVGVRRHTERDRVSERVEHVVAVARRQSHDVIAIFRDRREVELQAAVMVAVGQDTARAEAAIGASLHRGPRLGPIGDPAQQRHGGKAGGAAKQVAARQALFQHARERRVAGGVVVYVFVIAGNQRVLV